MPVILSDETWTRIEKMLGDYESGVLRVIPGKGLKIEEQTTIKANCPGIKLGIDEDGGDGTGVGSLTVSDGTNTIIDVRRMNFSGSLFSVTSGGAGTSDITLKTETC